MNMRVLLADDHRMFRQALRNLLEKESDIEVVAEADDGYGVLTQAAASLPDVVCMDVNMPGLNGIEATRRLLASQPAIKVIGLSAYSDRRFVLDMLNAGAAGYVTKAEAGEELLRAIKTVSRERLYLCPEIAAGVVSALGKQTGYAQQPLAQDARQWQILQLLAEGSTAQLQELVEQYQKILQATTDGFVMADSQGYLVEVNQAFCRMIGWSRSELLQSHLGSIEALKSESEFNGHWQQIIQRGKDRYETRLRSRNGALLDVDVSACHIADAGHIVCFVRDISDKKRAEERLRLTACVFESTGEGVMITDRHNRIEAINAAFTRITGFDASDAIGQTPALLKSGRHPAEFYQHMWQELSDLGHWSGEIWDRRKNGEAFAAWLTVSVVRDDHHDISHYVALFSDITTVKESRQRTDYLAHHDPLTGLPNRLLLTARMEHAIEKGKREGGAMAVLFIDLDNFKAVNDLLGHRAGDVLLQELASAMRATLRAEDTLARIGGDEFVVLLESIAGLEDVQRVARELLAIFPYRLAAPGGELRVGASIGVSLFPEHGDSFSDLIALADQAMYQVKRGGRGAVCFYCPQ